jgi:glycosyltransferase involved in cell wall biosynthesis
MNILLVNWQDWTNPQAGGAEVHIREIFSRIVAAGHSVDLLCSSYVSASSEEFLDGIRVIRRGGRHNFNYRAMLTLATEFRNHAYDIVVEDINKIPCYSSLFKKSPHLVIVPHLFGTTVFKEVAWPVAAYVYAWELPMKRFYRGSWFEVISESTKEDLVERGIPEESIHVIYCGIDHEMYTTEAGGNPTEPPYILYLGRLKRYKGIELVLDAFEEIRARRDGVRLVIAGDGDHRGALERKCRSMGLEPEVTFTGNVPEEEKIRLYRGASLVMNTSEKEGWGLTNIEAQACGCPVVATDSPGLRESVVDGETGFLVRGREKGDLAQRALEILVDPLLRSKLSEGGRRWVRRFTWERAAEETLDLMREVVESYEKPHAS